MLGHGGARAWAAGACCYSDDSCAEVPSLADCTAGGGFYLGGGSACLADHDGDGKDNACLCPCDADVDNDGFVTMGGDGAAVANCIGQPPRGDCAQMDIDCDGAIDDFNLCAVSCSIHGGTREQCCEPHIRESGACCLPSGACIIGSPTDCCDVNNDEHCNALDVDSVWGCRGPPTEECERADVDCNGRVDAIDVNIVWCLVGGGGLSCCSIPVPIVFPWGMIAMTLLGLTAGTIMYRKRRGATAS